MRWKPSEFSGRRQCQETAAEAVDSDSVKMGRRGPIESVSSIEQPPCHGSDFIEALERLLRLRDGDRNGLTQPDLCPWKLSLSLIPVPAP
jgi:hypothetical protein